MTCNRPPSPHGPARYFFVYSKAVLLDFESFVRSDRDQCYSLYLMKL